MPTSPRGTIPNPTVVAPQRPMDHEPTTPPTALVITPSTTRATTRARTDGSASAPRSSWAPVNAKKNGVKIWASGRISCSSSSCASVSATIRPATNAPMIAASPTYAEISASANMSMNAGTSGVSANIGQVNTSRFMPRARRAAANPSPISPNADDQDAERGLRSRRRSRRRRPVRSRSGPGCRRSLPRRARPARTSCRARRAPRGPGS